MLHALRTNTGFAAANNVGIRATAGELLLLLNNDTVVPPGAIDALVARLEAHPDAAVAGPRLVDAAGRPELSFGPMISPLGELRQKAVVALHGRDVAGMTAWVRRATGRERYVDWVSGACLVIRRADLEAVGLLDERFFLYTEDVDLCAAVRARGRQVLFAAEIEIIHRRGQSVASARTASDAAYRSSQMAFYKKHHPRWATVLRVYLKLRGR
jgi:GT2 family glycosyltransferase